MSIFVAGEIVCLDNDQSVMFTIVHVHEEMVWIKPYAYTTDHTHYTVRGNCKCDRNDLVDASRLWLKTWLEKNQLVR